MIIQHVATRNRGQLASYAQAFRRKAKANPGSEDAKLAEILESSKERKWITTVRSFWRVYWHIPENEEFQRIFFQNILIATINSDSIFINPLKQ